MGKRAMIPLLFLELLLAPGLIAQVPLTFTVSNKQTVAKIINAQAAACRDAENATSEAELDALDLPLQQMIQDAEQRVRRASADTAPARAAQKALAEAEAKLKPLETRLGQLQATRNAIVRDSLQPRLDRITATLGGDNPARRSIDAVQDSINSLRGEIARAENALKEFLKKNPDRSWWQVQTGEALDESLGKTIRDKQAELARLEAHQLTILRATIPLRGDTLYALQNQKKKLDDDIQELEADIRPLREARDAANQKLGDLDLEGIKNLAQLHEENGFTEQYIREGRDCIQKRRTQLASGAGVPPPPAVPPATPAAPGGLASVYFVGTWTANCSGDLPPEAARTDGGDMNFIFSGGTSDQTELRVRVSFVGSEGKPVLIGLEGYGATGRVLNDGTIADGRGGASFYNLVWDGRIEADLTRGTGINIGVAVLPDKFKGNGNVTITDLYRTGGGTCTGTWTAATP